MNQLQVYFVQQITEPKLIKIGKSRDPQNRVDSISKSIGVELRTLAIIKADSMLEHTIHCILRRFRSHGEWFYPHPTVLGLVDESRSLGYLRILGPKGCRLPRTVIQHIISKQVEASSIEEVAALYKVREDKIRNCVSGYEATIPDKGILEAFLTYYPGHYTAPKQNACQAG